MPRGFAYQCCIEYGGTDINGDDYIVGLVDKRQLCFWYKQCLRWYVTLLF